MYTYIYIYIYVTFLFCTIHQWALRATSYASTLLGQSIASHYMRRGARGVFFLACFLSFLNTSFFVLLYLFLNISFHFLGPPSFASEEGTRACSCCAAYFSH